MDQKRCRSYRTRCELEVAHGVGVVPAAGPKCQHPGEEAREVPGSSTAAQRTRHSHQPHHQNCQLLLSRHGHITCIAQIPQRHSIGTAQAQHRHSTGTSQAQHPGEEAREVPGWSTAAQRTRHSHQPHHQNCQLLLSRHGHITCIAQIPQRHSIGTAQAQHRHITGTASRGSSTRGAWGRNVATPRRG